MATGMSSRAETLGHLYGADKAVIVDPATGHYLLLAGLGKIPVDASLRKMAIAIVDSGIAVDHPQLIGRVVKEIDFTGEGVKDEIGHGTVIALLSVASLAAARAKTSPTQWFEEPIFSLKVVTREGNIKKSAVLDALAWIEKSEIKVVNMSLGFQGPSEEFADLCATISRNKNAVFMAAAGNSGPGVTSYPAGCKIGNLVSVGLLGPDGKPDPMSGKAEIYEPGSAMMVPRAQLLFEQAMVLARNGDLAGALTKIDESIADKPLAEAYNQKGLIFFARKNYAAAETEFRKAVQLQRGYAEGLLNLGLSRYLQNDLNGARPLIEQALDLAPDDLRIRFNLSLVLMDLGDYSGALDHLQTIKDRDSNYKNLQETIQEVRRRMGPL